MDQDADHLPTLCEHLLDGTGAPSDRVSQSLRVWLDYPSFFSRGPFARIKTTGKMVQDLQPSAQPMFQVRCWGWSDVSPFGVMVPSHCQVIIWCFPKFVMTRVSMHIYPQNGNSPSGELPHACRTWGQALPARCRWVTPFSRELWLM